MNPRRRFVAALGAGWLAVPLRLHAQPQGKVWRIGFLGAASAAGYVKETDAIRAGLRDLGYVEGRNVVIEYRWAENDPDRLKKLATELVALKPDAIITHALPATRVLAQATSTIPIIMADGQDPAVAGLVASLSRPGGNITGSTSFQPEIAAKRLELLKDVLPQMKRVSVIFNGANPNSADPLRELDVAAKRLKVELLHFGLKEFEELPGTFNSMAKARVEAVVVGEDPLLNSHAGSIATLAVANRIPASGFTNFADAGGLLGYGANRPLVYGRAAYFVDRIFKGSKPGDLPIERATTFELIVNLKIAKVLGITIPQELLQRANKVIK